LIQKVPKKSRPTPIGLKSIGVIFNNQIDGNLFLFSEQFLATSRNLLCTASPKITCDFVRRLTMVGGSERDLLEDEILNGRL